QHRRARCSRPARERSTRGCRPVKGRAGGRTRCKPSHVEQAPAGMIARAGGESHSREQNLVRRPRAPLVGAAAVVAGALVLTLPGCGRRSHLSVTIAGRDEQVTEGTTLAGVASAFDLRPKPGNLLDVQGAVLRAGAFPGSLLVNGRSVPRSTKL